MSTRTALVLFPLCAILLGGSAPGQDNLVQVTQDFSADPGWEGVNNQVVCENCPTVTQAFGWNSTNRSGGRPGEIGGTVWQSRTPAYSALSLGRPLSFRDAFSASGRIAVMPGGNGAAYIGYFNVREKMAAIADERAGAPLNDSMGITIEGPTRIGYYFSALCSPRRELASRKDGPIFLPTGDRHAFRFAYDPTANGGVGRITVTLDGTTFPLALTPDQRAAGANFDRFGLTNIRRGGKYVTVYFDDLTYTARRAKGFRSIHHRRETVTVRYPAGGRKY